MLNNYFNRSVQEFKLPSDLPSKIRGKDLIQEYADFAWALFHYDWINKNKSRADERFWKLCSSTAIRNGFIDLKFLAFRRLRLRSERVLAPTRLFECYIGQFQEMLEQAHQREVQCTIIQLEDGKQAIKWQKKII
jgi:hypothetical protein